MPLILVLALLLGGGGVSVAAENAVPGSVLYPVKVNVNEKVRGAIALSDESKAKWESRVAERRLIEAEKLASQSNLSAGARAQIEENFKEFADKVGERVKKIEEKNPEVAARLSADFEAALKAHEGILDSLDENKDEATKEESKNLREKINEEIKDALEKREESEKKLLSATSTEMMKSASEGILGAAENKIEEVKKFIAGSKERLGAEAVKDAEGHLKDAEEAIAAGKKKISEGNYKEAFLLFRKAHSIAQESKLLIEAKTRFEDKLEIKSEDGDQDGNIGEDLDENLDEDIGRIKIDVEDDLKTRDSGIPVPGANPNR